MIELKNLSKVFGEQLAVADLSLHVPAGEIYGLLGHNGAGKSTAIGMMLGQVWPSSGEAIVCGYNVAAQRKEALQKVGAIFETPAFYEYLSGWRNLEVLSSYSGRTSAARISEVVHWVGLDGREDGKVRTYSHGMRARLALAQALLPNPKLLILDEPSNGLDPEGIHEMRKTILRLRNELGLTILLSSHLLNEVEQLCTRIAVLSQGRKVFEGTLDQARRHSNWVRLKVDNFPSALDALRNAGLVKDSRNGNQVALAEGRATSELVRHLVHAGFEVHEVALEEETLEDFYLGLMSGKRGGKP